jgi:hypothetical protein
VGSYATGLTMKVERLPSSGGPLLGSGCKPARAQLFHTYSDTLSEHDMDFDWADETIHASYGKHWLTAGALLTKAGRNRG